MYHQNPHELLREIKKSYEDNTETSIDLEMLLDGHYLLHQCSNGFLRKLAFTEQEHIGKTMHIENMRMVCQRINDFRGLTQMDLL